VAAQDAEILPIRRPVKRKDLLGIEVCNLPPRTAVKGLTNENDDLLDGSRHGTSRQIAVSEWIASVPDHPGRTAGLVPRDAPRDRARPHFASAAENHANATRQVGADRRRIENPNSPAAELNLGFRLLNPQRKERSCFACKVCVEGSGEPRAGRRHQNLPPARYNVARRQLDPMQWPRLGLNPPPSVEANLSSRCLPNPTIPAEISNKLRKTSIRFTEADRKLLAKLQSLTGLRHPHARKA
jgi:hypothetical protein